MGADALSPCITIPLDMIKILLSGECSCFGDKYQQSVLYLTTIRTKTSPKRLLFLLGTDSHQPPGEGIFFNIFVVLYYHISTLQCLLPKTCTSLYIAPIYIYIYTYLYLYPYPYIYIYIYIYIFIYI